MFVTGPNRSEMRLSPALQDAFLARAGEEITLAANGFNQWCAGPAYEICDVKHILGSQDLVESLSRLAPGGAGSPARLPGKALAFLVIAFGLLSRGRTGRTKLAAGSLLALSLPFAWGFTVGPGAPGNAPGCSKLPWATSDSRAFFAHNVWEPIQNVPETQGPGKALAHLAERVQQFERSGGPPDATVPVGGVPHTGDWDTTWIQLDLARTILQESRPD